MSYNRIRQALVKRCLRQNPTMTMAECREKVTKEAARIYISRGRTKEERIKRAETLLQDWGHKDG